MLRQIQNFLTSLLSPKHRAQGIDGSHWWGKFIPELAKKPVDFIIIKATEGTSLIDSALKVNADGAAKIPVRGMYHYQRSGMSWLKQATFFLQAVAPYDNHIFALDVEEKGNEGVFATANNMAADTFFSDMRRIIDYWRLKEPGKRNVLYTNLNIYQNYLYPTIKKIYGLEGLQWLESLDLWLANVNGQGVDGEPNMPKNRNNWTIWQYSSNGRKEDYGTYGDVDLNVFNGTVEQLHKWIGNGGPIVEPTPAEPEPIPESETWTGRVVAFERLIVRSRPLKADWTEMGLRLMPREKVSGQLWIGNDYVWMKLDDNAPQTVKGKWVAVRKINGDQFIKLNPHDLPPVPDGLVAVRVIWDDENPDTNYRPRSLTRSLPAVYRYYPQMREKSGDYRVNLAKPSDWRSAIIAVNGGDVGKFNYLTGEKRALYNDPEEGWPQQAYLVMSGNKLQGSFIGNWFRFATLKQSDVASAAQMSIQSHPHLVHRFTCMGKTGRHIESTNTGRGQVYYFVVTEAGVGYIPRRHVVSLALPAMASVE